MIRNVKDKLLRNLSNAVGWRSKRRIVVIESDDWGSIRMPSLAAFERLNKKGLSMGEGESLRYNINDTLADQHDFAALFEVLSNSKDCKGNSAVFTAISLVANPDFEKIKQHNFETYFFETFTETLKRYYPNQNVFQYWQQGIDNKLFIPQFHGREHLNVAVWMKALQENNLQARCAFDEGFWGYNNEHLYNVKYQAAFDLSDPEELENQQKIIQEGLLIFEKLFGYKASFFVPPNGPFNNSLETAAAESGIKYMSTSKVQKEALGHGKTRNRLHYLGQKNKNGQIYITRNCFFEPSHEGPDWISRCLNEIEIAFKWGKPAVISSHRVNFIGALNEKNRENGLSQLSLLLKNILKKWPDAEFLSSDQLGDIIAASKK